MAALNGPGKDVLPGILSNVQELTKLNAIAHGAGMLYTGMSDG
jgi:hypothetical protein